jgi:DNA-binding winged helix-turn-helix (wHTH) protein/Tol biopolymer transport system component
MDYAFGPFRLETIKRRVWRGDQLVALTPKAIDTLVVLVTNAGAVVEKDDLLKAVWPDTFVEEATLAQNISTIRKALGDNSETPTYIATIPRRGYRFVASVTTPAGSGGGAAVTVDPARKPLWIAVTAALTAGLLVAVVTRIVSNRPVSPEPSPRAVFTITAPAGARFSASGSFLAASPDGRYVAFVATGDGGTDRLWLRPLDSPDARVLNGTDGAYQPFWSANGRSVAFFAGGKLTRVDIASGSLQTICNLPDGVEALAGTWNRNDDVLFALPQHGIARVPASGGVPTFVVRNGIGTSAMWPQFLPDGRHFLYSVAATQVDLAGIFVGSIDSAEQRRVAEVPSSASYAPPGYILFVKRGGLMAQPFDPIRLQTMGEPAPVADRVSVNPKTGRAAFSVSQNGILAYGTLSTTQLTWFDRTGKSLGAVGPPGTYLQFALAPDGRRIAASRVDATTGTSDIWIIEGADGSERRLTFDPGWETVPLWSRDGSEVLFTSDRLGRRQIFRKPADGGSADQPLRLAGISGVPAGWLPDGRLLLYQHGQRSEASDYWLVTEEGDRTLERLPDFSADVSDAAQVSPDGRWLAFEAPDAGWSIYARPVRAKEPRWQIASGGAKRPKWRSDGRELYYLAPDRSLMAVDVRPGATLLFGPVRRLFGTNAEPPTGLTGQPYDVSPDGERFLIKTVVYKPPITVIANWPSLVSSKPSR